MRDFKWPSMHRYIWYCLIYNNIFETFICLKLWKILQFFEFIQEYCCESGIAIFAWLVPLRNIIKYLRTTIVRYIFILQYIRTVKFKLVFNYTIVWNSELWEICIILEQFGIAIKCYLTSQLLKINQGTVSA